MFSIEPCIFLIQSVEPYSQWYLKHVIKIGSYSKQEPVKVDCYNLIQLTRSLIHAPCFRRNLSHSGIMLFSSCFFNSCWVYGVSRLSSFDGLSWWTYIAHLPCFRLQQKNLKPWTMEHEPHQPFPYGICLYIMLRCLSQFNPPTQNPKSKRTQRWLLHKANDCFHC